MMKKLVNSIPLVLFSFLGVASFSTISAELPVSGPVPFANYDLDGNGSISEQEFTQVRSERMASKAAQGRPMKGAGTAPSFMSFDVNQDGQLTEQELIVGQQAQMQNRRSISGQVSNMRQGNGKGVGMGRKSNMPSFSEFDINGDGVILAEELYEARAERISERVKQGYPMRNIANSSSFEEIDANGDQKVTSEEFAKFQVKHRQQMMQK
ncbi:EF-hand domain-containing protein [Colwellia sp. MSW7]|uniref:EF-hand domain-containing protein n=1 Tax=Colwellia maritima TaxID=2912588 RepID=A0ABS9X6E3_9GAMM|nr:EF-hand domain-containing protein [Colwellia maritima]MCI2285342.1 EF-hand domain-containing protein [Colwellia maritima]